MPFRGFAVVCILLTLFGMWFSSLVASVERPQAVRHTACLLGEPAVCRGLERGMR